MEATIPQLNPLERHTWWRVRYLACQIQTGLSLRYLIEFCRFYSSAEGTLPPRNFHLTTLARSLLHSSPSPAGSNNQFVKSHQQASLYTQKEILTALTFLWLTVFLDLPFRRNVVVLLHFRWLSSFSHEELSASSVKKRSVTRRYCLRPATRRHCLRLATALIIYNAAGCCVLIELF